MEYKLRRYLTTLIQVVKKNNLLYETSLYSNHKWIYSNLRNLNSIIHWSQKYGSRCWCRKYVNEFLINKIRRFNHFDISWMYQQYFHDFNRNIKNVHEMSTFNERDRQAQPCKNKKYYILKILKYTISCLR